MIEIRFEKDYLEQLYTVGKAEGKKHRYPNPVILKYKQTVDKIRAANRVEDLFPIKSLNYEKLQGAKRGLESVRVNRQYQ